jgi:hypothetical protein
VVDYADAASHLLHLDLKAVISDWHCKYCVSVIWINSGFF